MSSSPVIRSRREDDLEACQRIAEQVHALDGYPPVVPRDDVLAFVVDADALSAWVATDSRVVCGHVALHRTSSPPVMELASRVLGRSPAELGVVARLLVAPTLRRRGVARRLLDTARHGAVDSGRYPILDVVKQFLPAIALYESTGWRRIGDVTLRLPGGQELAEWVYAHDG